MDENQALVERTEPLKENRPYQLLFAIGRSFTGSILRGEVPPTSEAIDEPSDEDGGWDLVVQLVGVTNTLGPWSQALRLDADGPTGVLRFGLMSPVSGDERFWVVLLHKGQLVQSFVVWWGAIGARAELDQDREFSLDELDPDVDERTLSVVPLRDGGSTSLAVVAPGLSLKLELTQLGAVTERLSNEFNLAIAPSDDVGSPLGPWGGPPNPFALDKLRKLADIGQDLYDGLLTSATTSDQDALEDLLDQSVAPVALHRLASALTIPWAVVYDWVPDPANNAPICVDPSCDHDRTYGGYCAKGFWGVRLVLEEIPAARPYRGAAVIDRPPEKSDLLVTVDRDDGPSRELLVALGPFVGTGGTVHPTVGAGPVLDRLWSPVDLPVTLVVLYGETEGAQGGSGIAMSDGGTLAPRAVRKRWHTDRQDRLRAPGPLVFLLGCQTAAGKATDLASLTGNFMDAGAAAVVSTIGPVDARFLSKGCGGLLASLAQPGAVLGEAVRAWRAHTLEQGNPFPLAVAVCGEVQLSLKEAV